MSPFSWCMTRGSDGWHYLSCTLHVDELYTMEARTQRCKVLWVLLRIWGLTWEALYTWLHVPSCFMRTAEWPHATWSDDKWETGHAAFKISLISSLRLSLLCQTGSSVVQDHFQWTYPWSIWPYLSYAHIFGNYAEDPKICLFYSSDKPLAPTRSTRCDPRGPTTSARSSASAARRATRTRQRPNTEPSCQIIQVRQKANSLFCSKRVVHGVHAMIYRYEMKGKC